MGVLSDADVGVDAGTNACAVSVKFATTVCAAEVCMNATFKVGGADCAGAQEISKNVPMNARMNHFVFIFNLRFIPRRLRRDFNRYTYSATKPITLIGLHFPTASVCVWYCWRNEFDAEIMSDSRRNHILRLRDRKTASIHIAAVCECESEAVTPIACTCVL